MISQSHITNRRRCRVRANLVEAGNHHQMTVSIQLDMRYPPANPAQPNPTHRWAGWVGSVKTHGYHGLKLANLLGYGLTHSLGWGRLLGWVGM